MKQKILGGLLAALALAGCAGHVSFLNVAPNAPARIPATLYRPEGPGPFPAVVLLHGCEGVSASHHDWGRWFRERGYVALVLDSWTSRGLTEICSKEGPEIDRFWRFDDGIGALRYLQSLGFVDPARIGAIGWSNGGVYSMALINGPSLERAVKRGLTLPNPGYAAAVAVYPGGCFSLVAERVVKPLLVLIGEADDWTLAFECAQMVEAMRSRGSDATIVTYRGAYHYFDVEGQPLQVLPNVENRNRPGGCCGATVGYNAAAAADARRRVEEFFARHLKR
ncbi:MAG: dienelactone hydrolase family protein [Candidatus Rokubacteria bacterium]|nr:dienelactone hydrolase family protein [Candidatus Rokubacteria bacterium]